MDETVRTRKHFQQNIHHEKDCFSATERGAFLLADLDTALLELHRRFPHASLILEDRFGVAVRTIGKFELEGVSGCEWGVAPLLLNGREFGQIRYIGELGHLSRADIGPLVLSLRELEHWAQTEGERRGEKVQKLLAEGMTPEVIRLLSLCGLGEHEGYTLVALELASPTDKFLYMDLLREFMLARMWGYQASFAFVAYRLGGLLGVFPGADEPYWHAKLEEWVAQWNQYLSSLESGSSMEIRACLSSVDSLKHLDSGVRQVDTIMQFAARWNLLGLIRPRVSHTLTYMLSNLSEAKVFELVHRTLGPILVPEHMDLLHTLRVYLFLDQNVTEAAKSLYIHRNTLLYRIRHIEELLGIKLRNTAELSTVWSALEGLDLLELSGFDFFH
ncbi:helix-turn-helix domain-containing protein [Alicyclobacillus tolerans]|uniref:PucR family transcriptional regulator n=1 Tax=Alicyclobacillus tolerans TaxID=90970 RepID=UPI001F30A303|nr:helix-turn-helix domain-containing protein [Alicyclobacillus tolerans]MCF8563199.1 helix-turn-helix domain-containing protein [Alicyclobacillus tolerans]